MYKYMQKYTLFQVILSKLVTVSYIGQDVWDIKTY